MNGWINFKELRAKLDFEQVLRHYHVEVKRRGDQHLGFCPLPNHGGKKNSPSFSANLARGIFHCFGCGSKGNVLEFAALMENVNPQDGSALRNVAVELQRLFCRPQEDVPPPVAKISIEKPKVATTTAAPSNPPVVINEPLDFELKGLDAEHSYLLARGYTPETIRHFGLGFCTRGMLKDRVAIPLKDQEGRLVGYAGRVVDDSKISDENPRYRFPGARNRDGKVFEFRKTMFLYNGFRFQEPIDDLIVVEGFTSVWWLHQCGFPRVVATMGSDCSEEQLDHIVLSVKSSGRVWILPDGDAAGERLGETLLRQVSPRRFNRWVKLVPGKQPTDLSVEQLRALFTL